MQCKQLKSLLTLLILTSKFSNRLFLQTVSLEVTLLHYEDGAMEYRVSRLEAATVYNLLWHCCICTVVLLDFCCLGTTGTKSDGTGNGSTAPGQHPSPGGISDGSRSTAQVHRVVLSDNWQAIVLLVVPLSIDVVVVVGDVAGLVRHVRFQKQICIACCVFHLIGSRQLVLLSESWSSSSSSKGGCVIVEWLVCWTSAVGFQILARAEISLKISLPPVPAPSWLYYDDYSDCTFLVERSDGEGEDLPANLICWSQEVRSVSYISELAQVTGMRAPITFILSSPYSLCRQRCWWNFL